MSWLGSSPPDSPRHRGLVAAAESSSLSSFSQLREGQRSFTYILPPSPQGRNPRTGIDSGAWHPASSLVRLRGCVRGPSSPPSLNSWVTSGMSPNLSEPQLTYLTNELTCPSPHTALTQLKEMLGLSRVFEEDQRRLHENAETRTKDFSLSLP